MRKAVVIVAAVLILLPLVPRLIPKPVTFERVQAALEGSGFLVTNVRKVDPPMLKSVEQVSMQVNGSPVDVYRYDDRGAIATQLEYQKPDAGTVIVEAWNLSESLGAAKPKNKPVFPARNGMFMLVITTDDKALGRRVVKIFESL
jgi:hypothetical protein